MVPLNSNSCLRPTPVLDPQTPCALDQGRSQLQSNPLPLNLQFGFHVGVKVTIFIRP